MSSQVEKALKLWVVMNRAVRSIEECLRGQVERHGLSMIEFAVLEVLYSKGALPIGEIGGRVLRSSGSMTYVLDKLQQRNLLRRRPCDEDRRTIYAELTPEGRAKMDIVFPEHAALIASTMEALSPVEQERTTSNLRELGLSVQNGSCKA